jgi:DNA-directed RNA polymerase subunit RPC12/RpoP
MAASPKELTLINCTCGSKPVLVEKLGVISKSKMVVYKCPSCGQTGEMNWPADGENAIKSWNHTINTKLNHVKNKA